MSEKITVYGGGLIGAGWTVAFLLGGKDVTVYDINEACLKNTEQRIFVLMNRISELVPDVVSPERVEACRSKVRYTCDPEEAVRDATFIQENGPEKLPIKQSMVQTIEQYNTTAVIASSTSGLRITDIAQNAKHPERIVAGHPFNPVHLMPLVEVGKGEKSSDEAVEKACNLYKDIGKVPIVLNLEVKGFVCNRLQTALNREVQDLVVRGVCSVEDVDKAVTYGIGMRLGLIGPLMVQELAGGPEGIGMTLTKFGRSGEMLQDLATWTSWPEAFHKMAVDGIREEFAHRAPEMGTSHDSLESFRDIGLMKLLDYHGILKIWKEK